MGAFYELRQYKVLPGKLDSWVKLMEETIIPFQVSKGMVICGSFRGEEDDSVYVWLRRFESEEQREALYAAVFEDMSKGPNSERLGPLAGLGSDNSNGGPFYSTHRRSAPLQRPGPAPPSKYPGSPPDNVRKFFQTQSSTSSLHPPILLNVII